MTLEKHGNKSWIIKLLMTTAIKRCLLCSPSYHLGRILLNLPEMLAEVVVDVLHFLTRRDLDQACFVSKRFNALIAQCFDVFPLRPVREVELYKDGNRFRVRIRSGAEELFTRIGRSSNSLDKTTHLAASLLRQSYVDTLRVGYF